MGVQDGGEWVHEDRVAVAVGGVCVQVAERVRLSVRRLEAVRVREQVGLPVSEAAAIPVPVHVRVREAVPDRVPTRDGERVLVGLRLRLGVPVLRVLLCDGVRDGDAEGLVRGVGVAETESGPQRVGEGVRDADAAVEGVQVRDGVRVGVGLRLPVGPEAEAVGVAVGVGLRLGADAVGARRRVGLGVRVPVCPGERVGVADAEEAEPDGVTEAEGVGV